MVSMISWTVLPMRETSLVIRWSTSPTGVSSTNFTGRRRILSAIWMRRLQVKCMLTTRLSSCIFR